MTNKEAIKVLKGCTIYANGKASHEALDVAIKALKKQMPKKPLIELSIPKIVSCVECGAYVYTNWEFCPYCGQAIDWSK